MSDRIYLILGFGLTGRSVAKYLDNIGVKYKIFSHSLHNGKDERFEQVSALDTILEITDLIIVSPGFVVSHKVIQDAIRKKIPIITDIDIALSKIECAKIAVTGTNGKSTVTTWLTEALNAVDGKWGAFGNIGTPVLEANYEDNLRGMVVELSSQHLCYMKTLMFDWSIILPIAPDHIYWHGSFEDYKYSKLRLLENRRVIVHVSLLPDVLDKKVFTYGSFENKRGDVYVLDNRINFPDGRSLEFCPEYYWRNVDRENLCAVMAVLYFMNMLNLDVIPNYEFLPYRSNIWVKNNSWIVVNDSKATNLHAAFATIKAIRERYPGKKLFILMGGAFKEDFEMPELLMGDRLLLFGPTAKIHGILHYRNLSDAVCHVLEYINNPMVEPGVVVFAPGGASMDEFANYAERGRLFDVWMRDA